MFTRERILRTLLLLALTKAAVYATVPAQSLSERNWETLAIQGVNAAKDGDLERADQLLRLALKSLPQTAVADAVILRNELGRVLEALSRVDEAEVEYLQAIEINKAATKPLDAELAASLNNLASIRQGQGLWQAAAPLLLEASAIIFV